MFSVYIANFPYLSRNVIRYVILGTMNSFLLWDFENAFMYCKRIIFMWDSFSIDIYFLLKYDNYSIIIFNWFSILGFQGWHVRLNITIYTYKVMFVWMEKSGCNCPYIYFNIMGGDKLVFLWFHGWFHTGIILQVHQKWVFKWIKVLIMIWGKVFFKLRTSFGGLLISQKIFS